MGEKCGKWSFLRHYAAKDVHERHLRKLNWTWTSAYTRKLKKHRKLCGTKTKLSRDISVIALYAGVWICNRGNSGMLESIPRLTFSSSHSVSLFPSWICWTLFIQKSSKVIKKACCGQQRRWMRKGGILDDFYFRRVLKSKAQRHVLKVPLSIESSQTDCNNERPQI